MVGVNAQKESIRLEVTLPMLAGKEVELYTDNKNFEPQVDKAEIKNTGIVKLTIQPNGGVILVE